MALPAPLEQIVLSLDGHLKRLAPTAGWDAAKATRLPKDPAGKVRLGYLSHQGTFLVHVDDATPYLEWLVEGNVGTIMKWAKERGRRLK